MNTYLSASSCSQALCICTVVFWCCVCRCFDTNLSSMIPPYVTFCNLISLLNNQHVLLPDTVFTNSLEPSADFPLQPTFWRFMSWRGSVFSHRCSRTPFYFYSSALSITHNPQFLLFSMSLVSNFYCLLLYNYYNRHRLLHVYLSG